MRVTIKHVASKAGVSYQTVSKVINGQGQVSKETEERIWSAVKALGYRPNYTARSLRSNRSLTIGYSWIPLPVYKASPVLDQLLQSMLKAAVRRGYYLLSFPYQMESTDQTTLYRELIYTGRVDGFILSSVEYNDPRVLFLMEHNFPFVAFGRSNPELAFPYVDVDGGLGLRHATEHLIEQGHERIACLALPVDSRVGNNRFEGYAQAMADAGLSIRSEWIERGEGSFNFGYEATNRLMAISPAKRPTAVVSLNDLLAIGAMHAIAANGLQVGRDVAVTGFDDIPLIQYLNPPLTSVRQPIWQVGQVVIDMLLSIMNDGEADPPENGLLPPELIVRASSLTNPIDRAMISLSNGFGPHLEDGINRSS
jgi:DNA-binding LacI/PurR family transcriptional regulator